MATATPSWNMASLRRRSPCLMDGLVERLLWATLQDLAQTYGADVAVWAGFMDPPDEARIYLLGEQWQLLDEPPTEPLESPSGKLQCLALPQYPEWLMAWEGIPKVRQLSIGDLLVPIVCLAPATEDFELEEDPAVALVVQLRRPPVATEIPLLTAEFALMPSISGWTEAELQELDLFSRQLATAFQQATLQDRLSWGRRQSGLVGRMTHLLNSSLKPDVVLQQILAELGQSYGCDRSFIVDLRNPSQASLTAHWEKAQELSLPPDISVLSSDLWEAMVEEFLQDGVSYQVLQASEEEGAELCEVLKVDQVFLVPIFLKTDFFGVLGLALDNCSFPYRVETLQTLYQVADHVAIALHQILSLPDDPLPTKPRGDATHPLGEWYDPLTRLPDRDALDQELIRLSHSTLWPTQPDFSVLMVDIDYFKLINDTYGNPAGDEVLYGVAQRLQNQLRQGTLVYRYGGEEFLILLNRTRVNPAADVAERLRATVQGEPVKTSAGLVDVTASFGVTQRDRTRDTDAYSVVERAEQAMLEAKRQGRNRIKVL